MDLLQGVRDAQGDGPIIEDENLQTVPHPAGDFQMPTPEKLLEMLDKLNMSDEEKEKIREGFIKNIAQQVQGQGSFIQSRLLIVTCCVLVLLLIFAFFGYKLYRSQTEKERKREEKKKQKQQKKKHK